MPLVTAWLGGEQLLRGATQVLVAVARRAGAAARLRAGFAPQGALRGARSPAGAP